MTGLNLYTTQQTLFDYIDAQIPWKVVDAEVPDADTVLMVEGEIEPYVVVRFSDLLGASGQNSFGGPTYDGYYSLFQCICVGSTGLEALHLQSQVNTSLIGHVPDVNSGPITKDFGGGSLAIKGVNTSPSFFVAISAFRYLTNMQIPN